MQDIPGRFDVEGHFGSGKVTVEILVGMRQISPASSEVLVRPNNTVALADDDVWWMQAEELARDFYTAVRARERARDLDFRQGTASE